MTVGDFEAFNIYIIHIACAVRACFNVDRVLLFFSSSFIINKNNNTKYAQNARRQTRPFRNRIDYGLVSSWEIYLFLLLLFFN